MARPYRGKRVVDLALTALFGLPALALGTIAAIAVKATSRGPVFFRQQRVGLNGATFDVVKFRTMVHGDNPIIPDANHITRVGVWLRRLSIDELPQLINVARGEMSFVGPRPTLQYQVDRYTDEQRGRLAVKPGLTGWAQVNGRNAIDWDERIALDLEYVRRQSPLFDLKIIVRTFTTLISGDGVEGHSTHDRVSRSEP
jgi:lipopolysaccharide/colanic/teichoic acid biosynthesis glycosyltransferase